MCGGIKLRHGHILGYTQVENAAIDFNLSFVDKSVSFSGDTAHHLFVRVDLPQLELELEWGVTSYSYTDSRDLFSWVHLKHICCTYYAVVDKSKGWQIPSKT